MHGLVLTAAGASTRFGGGPPKVLRPLAGRPVLCHALDTFRAAIEDLAVVVTARAEDREAIAALAGDARVVAGGATRQASVAAGLCALPDDLAVILVHDAARPLVSPALVRAVLAAAEAHGAAVAAVPVTDTLHHAPGAPGPDGTRRLLPAPPRAELLAAQTPQAARADLLRRAYAAAEATGRAATAEAGALHLAGIEVVAVPGEPSNRKLTTAADLALLERLLGSV